MKKFHLLSVLAAILALTLSGCALDNPDGRYSNSSYGSGYRAPENNILGNLMPKTARRFANWSNNANPTSRRDYQTNINRASYNSYSQNNYATEEEKWEEINYLYKKLAYLRQQRLAYEAATREQYGSGQYSSRYNPAYAGNSRDQNLVAQARAAALAQVQNDAEFIRN